MSVCLYVCLCVQSGMVSKFDGVPFSAYCVYKVGRSITQRGPVRYIVGLVGQLFWLFHLPPSPACGIAVKQAKMVEQLE